MNDPKHKFNLDGDNDDVSDTVEETPQYQRSAKYGFGDDDDYASDERFEEDKFKVVDFYRYPREKRKLTEFLEETYKEYERENVERTIARVQSQHDSELRGSTPFYKPGHIGPLMYEFLNMIGIEATFVSGLQHTKSSMTKSVQQRVDEINTLLRGVGGFNRQIKASFSRSAVVYLEREDPEIPHREKIVFSVNLGNFELRYPLDETADQKTVEDGRTLKRLVWDEAVNTIAEIVSNTGLKPKYVKNDKNSCAFTMRQSLLSENEREPDEFFILALKYFNEEARQTSIEQFTKKLEDFDIKLNKLRKNASSSFLSRKKKKAFQEQLAQFEKKKGFFIATNPDPREMDTGLVFTININTLKDYTLTKDKMQVLMTKYILALSLIAVDKSLDQQVSTVYQQAQGEATDFQHLAEKVNGTEKAG